jgi:hypothetical protein
VVGADRSSHAVAHERKIQETSSRGRYHKAGTGPWRPSCGVTLEQAGPIGWSRTAMPDETAARYRRAPAKPLTASRPEVGGRNGRANSNNGLSLTCERGRRIRCSRPVDEQG